MPYDNAWKMIGQARRILMTTHVKPDGDGLGSLAALGEHLRREGKLVRIVLPTAAGKKYACVPGFDGFEVLGSDVLAEELGGMWDLLVVIDTCTWEQLDGLGDLIRRHQGRVLVIDHHLTRDELQHRGLIDEKAAAAGQIVMKLLETHGAAITATMATSLYVSLVSDTGWFRFPNVTAEVMQIGGRLMELGASPPRIFEQLHQSESLAKIRLMREALSTLTVCEEGRVAYFWLSREMFARSGAAPTDTENIIDESQKVAGVIVGLLFVEDDKGTIRVSLRSKRDVDVGRLAAGFGGGGHARAAGCRLQMPPVEARQAVLAAVHQALSREPAAEA
ncbi:MAG: bifunctional oligoribonuclease/PAP phosphatase NrnA [Anaerolineaceae bacterium]|nr:bifunctional oligoribonuclease/PAP phosphatase NrnA [Anaerolineaceae bacterium]